MSFKEIHREKRALSLAIVFGAFVLNSLSGPEERTAIVCFLEGKVRLFETGIKEGRDLQLFDWLGAGAVIEAADIGRIVLAFANGDRYELRGRFRATLKANGFASTSGTPIKLTSVPVMPQLASLAAESKPGTGSSAIRLRGRKHELGDLYPGRGWTALADGTVLSFTPIDLVERYRVELEDEWGNRLLSVETTSKEVNVSPGILKPGANYYWWVVTLDKVNPSTTAEAEFSTISAEQAKLRNAFKVQAMQMKEVTQLLLLSQLDLVLGLRKEACATLREALALFPENGEIKRALERAGCNPPK